MIIRFNKIELKDRECIICHRKTQSWWALTLQDDFTTVITKFFKKNKISFEDRIYICDNCRDKNATLGLTNICNSLYYTPFANYIINILEKRL